jgi:hypothetical protein
MASLMVDLIDTNKDVQESNESEVWKLGYYEATDEALRLMAVIFEQLKNERED